MGTKESKRKAWLRDKGLEEGEIEDFAKKHPDSFMKYTLRRLLRAVMNTSDSEYLPEKKGKKIWYKR